MKKRITKDWIYAALIRALRSSSQAALSVFTIGATMSGVQWTYVITVAGTAAVYSILTSLATGLPETKICQKEEQL